MTLVVTPTQFNRESSRVLRTVRAGQDVLVESRDGQTILVTLLGKQTDAVEEAVRAGRAQPPVIGYDEDEDDSFPVLPVSREVAAAVLAEFAAERDANAY